MVKGVDPLRLLRIVAAFVKARSWARLMSPLRRLLLTSSMMFELLAWLVVRLRRLCVDARADDSDGLLGPFKGSWGGKPFKIARTPWTM